VAGYLLLSNSFSPVRLSDSWHLCPANGWRKVHNQGRSCSEARNRMCFISVSAQPKVVVLARLSALGVMGPLGMS